MGDPGWIVTWIGIGAVAMHGLMHTLRKLDDDRDCDRKD